MTAARKKNIAKGVALVIAAIAIMYLGGQTRTYPAFGGEDLVGLALIAWATVPEKEDEE